MIPRVVVFLVLGIGSVGNPGWGLSDTQAAQREKDRRPLRTIAVMPPRDRLVVGERLSFHGRWFGIPIGSGWIEVKEVVTLEGRQAYHLEARGYSNKILSAFYPVHDVLHSYVDVETFRPLRFEKYQQEGHYRAQEVVIFDYDRLIATYRSLLNRSVKEVPIPKTVHDLLSAFYWLRTQPIVPGESVVLDVYSDEKSYRVEVKTREPLELELLRRGTFTCFVMEPIARFKGVLVKRGRLWAYFTIDEARLPLLVKITTPWGPFTGVIDPASLQGVGNGGQAR